MDHVSDGSQSSAQKSQPLIPIPISGGGTGPVLYQNARSFGFSAASGSTYWHLVKASHMPEKMEFSLST